MKNFHSTIIALAALVSFTGCKAPTTNSTTSSGTIQSEPTTANVVRKDLEGYVFFDGKVFTPNGVSATVNSPYDIAVSEVLTSVGKRVNRGETIIKLSIPSVTGAVAQAEANVAAAQSAYAAAKSANDPAVREAAQLLAQAQTEERAARADVQNGGSADLQGATDARIAAERALREAQGQLNMAVLAEKQSLDAANEYLKDARAGAKLANVRAPISGTVMTLEAKPGMQAKAKEVLAMITDLQALRIQGVVPPEHADLVKRGVNLLIAIDGPNSDPLEGEVSEVSVLPPSEGQKSAGYLAVVRFDNRKGLVQPGTAIKRLGVRTGKVENALVVPIGAISKDSAGKAVVFVRRGSDWSSTNVEVGISDGALTEIKTGLAEGDVVRVNAVVLNP